MKNHYIFRKPKAKQRIEISPDLDMDPEGWFLSIRYIENKSNKIKNEYCIIEKNLYQWLDSLTKDGWIKETQN